MPLALLTENDFAPKRHTEAERAFRRKVALTREEFDRLSAANKAHAFTVANVHNGKLVQAIRDVMARATRDGRTFAQIHRELSALFDGSGIPKISLQRLRFAYQENARQAYSDARSDAMSDPETAAVFPFWKYLTVGNGTPGFRGVRADHAALHGKTFAVGDPFWRTFKPPWDYGCRCGWIALTAGQVTRSRETVWTLRGGTVVPAARKRKGQKSVRLQRNTKYDRSTKALDLSGLDADLRKLLTERLKT